MNKRNFKIREEDYKAMQGMTEKQAGQFIKGLCCYAFEGVPMETKDAKIASAYAKVALDISARNRENGRKGGLLVAERMRRKNTGEKPQGSGDPVSMLLKGIVMSSAEKKK